MSDEELIAVSDRAILADKIDHWNERADVTVFLSVREAFDLAGEILTGIEWAVGQGQG